MDWITHTLNIVLGVFIINNFNHKRIIKIIKPSEIFQ